MSALDGPVLALDSSGRAAYVAVGTNDGRVLAEEAVASRANASSALLPAVDRVVRGAGLTPADLIAVVVGGGPGSFTGLRIAAATAKAVARARGIPLHAYSGLLAAAAAHREGGMVCGVFDARNRDVYAGCWRIADGVEEVMPVSAMGVDELAVRLRGEDVRFAGEGAVLHADLLADAFGADAVAREERSLAAGLLWLVRTVPEMGRVDAAAAWEPEYVRASGAERIAARGAG